MGTFTETAILKVLDETSGGIKSINAALKRLSAESKKTKGDFSSIKDPKLNGTTLKKIGDELRRLNTEASKTKSALASFKNPEINTRSTANLKELARAFQSYREAKNAAGGTAKAGVQVSGAGALEKLNKDLRDYRKLSTNLPRPAAGPLPLPVTPTGAGYEYYRDRNNNVRRRSIINPPPGVNVAPPPPPIPSPSDYDYYTGSNGVIRRRRRVVPPPGTPVFGGGGGSGGGGGTPSPEEFGRRAGAGWGNAIKHDLGLRHFFMLGLGYRAAGVAGAAITKGASEVDVSRNRGLLLGFKPEDKAFVEQTTQDIARTTNLFTDAQIRNLLYDNAALLKDKKAAATIIPELMRNAKVAMLQGMSADEAVNQAYAQNRVNAILSTFTDQLGNFDVKAFKETNEALMRAQIISGRDLPTSTILAIARNARVTGQSLTPEALTKLFILGADVQQSAGVMANQFVKNMSGASVMPKQLRHQIKLGLSELTSGNIDKGPITGRSKDPILLRNDPFAYVDKYILNKGGAFDKFLAERGVADRSKLDDTEFNAYVAEFGDFIASHRTASDFVTKAMLQNIELQNQGLNAAAIDVSDANLDAILNQSTIGQMQIAMVRMTNAFGLVADSLEGVIIPSLKAVQSGFDAISNWVKNPDGTTDPLRGAAVVGGATATVAGIIAIWNAPAILLSKSAVQLSASAVALDSAALALRAGAVAGAVPGGVGGNAAKAGIIARLLGAGSTTLALASMLLLKGDTPNRPGRGSIPKYERDEERAAYLTKGMSSKPFWTQMSEYFFGGGLAKRASIYGGGRSQLQSTFPTRPEPPSLAPRWPRERLLHPSLANDNLIKTKPVPVTVVTPRNILASGYEERADRMKVVRQPNTFETMIGGMGQLESSTAKIFEGAGIIDTAAGRAVGAAGQVDSAAGQAEAAAAALLAALISGGASVAGQIRAALSSGVNVNVNSKGPAPAAAPNLGGTHLGHQ